MCVPPMDRLTDESDRSGSENSLTEAIASRSFDQGLTMSTTQQRSRSGPPTTVSLPTLMIALFLVTWGAFASGRQFRAHMDHHQLASPLELILDAIRRSDATEVFVPDHPLDVHQSNWSDVTDSRQQSLAKETVIEVNEMGEILETDDDEDDDDEDDDDEDDDDEDDDDDEEADLGVAGKRYAMHMIADIQYVDMDFLNSQERLIRAMEESAAESDTTLVAHYCFSMEPMGVSCAGELLDEGRITFHTWPIEGVITMDILTFSKRAPLPSPVRVKEIFGLPRGKEPPEMKWFIRPRARPRENVMESDDLTDILTEPTFGKERVATVKTNFQTVDVWDITGWVDPEIELSKYITKRHAEADRKERIVFLDGCLQSRQYGEAAYHEALVHPALFLHPEPKRVAIIGGGEGATLREVLKHNTLENVVMIEIDEIMVNVSRTHIPDWSDCSDIVGSRKSCFDDPRAEVNYGDAITYFTDHFRDENNRKQDVFDVIIMDAL